MNPKIFQSISDVVLVVNDKAKIIEVSDSVKDTFQYDKEELIGEPMEILMPERFREKHKVVFAEFTRKPTTRRMGSGNNLFARRKDGREFSIDIALSTFSEKDVTFYVAIVRDISNLIEYQSKLEYLNHELTLRNEELDQYAYVVSHDLKSPVSNIIGMINLIRSDKPDFDDELEKYFGFIEDSSWKVNELIEGILEYSQVDQADMELNVFDIRDLVDEIIHAEVTDKFTVKTSCPTIKIMTSRVQLFQVLTNLISNAVKYHHHDSGLIEICCDSTNTELNISIEDDGPGIEDKYHNKIFEMFGKAHVDDRSDSTGIGLAIVKKLIDKNGGSISVHSKSGKGTKFNVAWKLSSNPVESTTV